MSDERLPPPPVEPLSDLSWARLERQLWQALDAPTAAPAPTTARARWRWPVVAGAAVAAAAAAALLWPSAPSGHGPLGTPRTTGLPSRVATAAAETSLTFGDAAIRLAPHSALYLRGDERGVDLVLDRGQASFEVTPRLRRAPFVVNAGAVRVTVVGTGFSVTRLGDGAVVEVRHGVVEVVADGAQALVHAGETWDASGVHPTAIVATGDRTARADAPPIIDTPTPPTPAPTVGAPTIAPPTPGTVDAPRPRPHAPPPDGAATAFDPKAAYSAAAALEATAPDRAIASYLALAAHGGAWGANALFAAARLRSERGDTAGARALAQRYLRAYPHGANAVDARALLGTDAP